MTTESSAPVPVLYELLCQLEQSTRIYGVRAGVPDAQPTAWGLARHLDDAYTSGQAEVPECLVDRAVRVLHATAGHLEGTDPETAASLRLRADHAELLLVVARRPATVVLPASV